MTYGDHAYMVQALSDIEENLSMIRKLKHVMFTVFASFTTLDKHPKEVKGGKR